MSAFLVKHESIGLLAAAAHSVGALQYGITYDDRQKFVRVEQVAEILARENLRSINSRYGDADDDDEAREYIRQCKRCAIIAEDQRIPAQCQIHDLAKLASCYDYQACETDDYYQSDAHRVIIQLRGGLLSKLDGYQNSDYWG